MIRFSCPSCGHAIKVPDEVAGKTGRCKCGERVRIPSPPHSTAFKAPSPSRLVPAPPPVPPLPELPEWLASAYPHASPAVLQSLREWWRDAQQAKGDGNAPARQPTIVPLQSPSAAVEESAPSHPAPALLPTPVPKFPSPTGKIICCYACGKQVADTALSCPKCGAAQTPEGKEKGRQMKKQAETFALIVTLVLAVPFFLCCFGIISNSHNSNPPPQLRGPAGWDQDQLKRDVEDVVRDPSKTIYIPSDGSQPRVVPDP